MRHSPDSHAPPHPRLSIGIPVYNGRRYVARAIESILGQTYRDFELIISDNASTDDTQTICERYAGGDARVRYFRAATNGGIVRNFNRCFELARATEYFKWQAADDLCAPTFLEKCAGVLDADPSVALAFGRSVIIDEQDRPKRLNTYDSDADDPRPHVRFGRLINIDHRRHAAQEIYGVIRRAALARTPLYQPHARADSVLLARLALLGRFRVIDEPLFFNREHEERSVEQIPGRRGARRRTRLSGWLGTGPIPPTEFWDPSHAGRINFPEWRILYEYERSIRMIDLSLSDRARCRLTLARFAMRHTPKLIRDLVIAAEHAAMGSPRS
jgi:glycosyltransferase involved in cell wall biosynthesis